MEFMSCRRDDQFASEDDGTIFLDALENRHTSFGSLSLHFDKDLCPLSRANLERLFRLETIDEIDMCHLNNELILLPLSAKANALTYQV
jgi:hypothetical protein